MASHGDFTKKRKMGPQSVPALQLDSEPNQTAGGALVVNNNLDVQGIVRAEAFLQSSDLRLKTDIEDIADALSIISQIGGHRYRWRQDNPKVPQRGGEQAIGLIAQEVQKGIFLCLPLLVPPR